MKRKVSPNRIIDAVDENFKDVLLVDGQNCLLLLRRALYGKDLGNSQLWSSSSFAQLVRNAPSHKSAIMV